MASSKLLQALNNCKGSTAEDWYKVKDLLKIIWEETPESSFAGELVKLGPNINHCLVEISFLMAQKVVPLELEEICSMRSGLKDIMKGKWAQIGVSSGQTLGQIMKSELSMVLLREFDCFLQDFCDKDSVCSAKSDDWWWKEAVKKVEATDQEEDYSQYDAYE